jgi:hypothetical protein
VSPAFKAGFLMAGCLRKHWHLNPPDLRGNLVFRPCLNVRPVMHDNSGDAGNPVKLVFSQFDQQKILPSNNDEFL